MGDGDDEGSAIIKNLEVKTEKKDIYGWPLFCFDSERRDAPTVEPVIKRNGKYKIAPP